MDRNEHQQTAIDNPCLHDGESLKAEYAYRRNSFAVKLIVNAGFESFSHGGPIWHATAVAIAPSRESGRRVSEQHTEHFLQSAAWAALLGVGDARLGEWHEWTGYAYHLRRRLSSDEQGYIDRMVTEEAAMQQRINAWKIAVQVR